jgi:predicted NBD/HSP70 family sugar kinase
VASEWGVPRCRNVGYLETLASTRAVLERARALAPESGDGGLARAPEAITFDSLVQAFEAGDPLAGRVVADAGRYMGQAVSGVMGALNVQRIVIAGEMARFGPPLLDVIRDTMPRTTLARAGRRDERRFRAPRPQRDNPRRLRADPARLLAPVPAPARAPRGPHRARPAAERGVQWFLIV